MSFIKNILLLALVGVLAYVYQNQILNAFRLAKSQYFPCAMPITYSIGAYDERFNLPRDEFLKYLKNAEDKWEAAYNKDLFKYEETGGMPVNLVYDSRQDATVKLKEMNTDIATSKESYYALKAKYDSTTILYQNEKEVFEMRVATFQARNKEYEKSVAFWNSKGGADKKTYSEFEAERAWLSAESNTLNSMQQTLNEKVGELNSMSRTLNSLSSALNLGVEKYNDISANQLGEFEEGVYHSGPDGEWIDIYQYENKTKLERVVMHEFGHALGLEHVQDRDAIMYIMNESANKELTKADIAELSKICNANIIDTIKQKIPAEFSGVSLDSIKNIIFNN